MNSIDSLHTPGCFCQIKTNEGEIKGYLIGSTHLANPQMAESFINTIRPILPVITHVAVEAIATNDVDYSPDMYRKLAELIDPLDNSKINLLAHQVERALFRARIKVENQQLLEAKKTVEATQRLYLRSIKSAKIDNSSQLLECQQKLLQIENDIQTLPSRLRQKVNQIRAEETDRHFIIHTLVNWQKELSFLYQDKVMEGAILFNYVNANGRQIVSLEDSQKHEAFVRNLAIDTITQQFQKLLLSQTEDEAY